ncbi:MAG: hypothetical protein LBU66_00590, partial [Treponema sp.]|nr:hypothetical protein [Treponema sp.]
MRKIIMLIVLCFLVFSCELFNAQNDPDYWEKLDEEIAWVNAEKLTVSVTFPAEWGTSPNSGTGRSFDNVRRNETPRKGYAFNVEFTPLPGFGFEKWLAFPTSEYSKLDFSKNAADVLSDSLNGKSVEIIESTSDTGARVATVKVNTSAPVTLIPWCSNRPAVIQSNPPLISSGFAYTRGQPITIWFSTDLDNDGDAKIDFGENLIKITGQHILDGRAWNDPNTPVNEEGDLTGQKDGTFSYFEKPVYNPDTRIISINPNTTNYPPENLIITVTVGTGIKGANGSEMNIPVSFSYQTTDEIATIAYKANNVWAIHDPHSTQVNAFFYQMAPEDRDRRLRKNTQGNYQVTLYFSISRSMGEIENPTPEALTIAEIYYANLAGVEPVDTYIPDYGMYGLGKEPERSIEYLPIEQNTESGSSAGGIYRQMNAGTNPLGIFYYKAVYTFAPDTPAGIYRLALMPWRGRETTSEGTRYQVAPEDWHLVVEEGRFVTVVIDDEAPGGSGSLEITGHGYSGKDGDLMGYNFTRDNSFLNINPHFSSIHDNGLTNGIRLEDSSPDKPWTMDNWDKLRWQWRIIQGETVIHNSDEWLPMGTSSAQFNVSSFTVTTPNPYRTIQTRFRDDLGNTSDWEDRAGIRYTDPRNSLPVSNLSAVYQENNNVIIVSWTTPTLMDGAKIYLNGAALPENDLPRNEGQTSYDYIITGVPRINSDGIKNGEKVKNVIEHTITVFAYKDNVEAEDDKETIIIWNIPGMSVSEANPLIPISDYSDLSQIVLGDPKVQYVLTKDIDVYERWIPLGSRDTNTDAFRGKLYGNGNKITIANGFVEGLYQNNSNQYYGLFGYIQEATIRDLEVEYSNSPYLKIDAAIITSRYGYYGGLVGFMGGTSANNGSKITNCIVRGEENKDVTLEISSSNGTLYTGGMVGLIEVSSIIDNCYSGINVKSTLTGGNNGMWAGGLAGHVKSSTTDSTRIIQGVYATGNVEATNTNGSNTANNLYAGGLIGQSAVNLIDSYAKGNVNTEIAITTTRYSNHHAGGLVGMTNRSVDKSYAEGKVSVLNRGNVYAGGLIGLAQSISNSYAIGDVKTIGDSNTHYVGGLVGNVNGGSVDKSHA